MTFLEMYNMSNTLLDKAGSPYFTESEFDIFCNIAYNFWIGQAYAELEITQGNKVRLKDLYKPFSKVGSNTVVFPTDIADFRYLIRFNGVFSHCGENIIRNIKPVRNNDIDILNVDPFNKPIATDPLYIVTSSGGLSRFEIYPTPISYSLTYIREPQVIDSNGSPSTVFELPDYLAQQIVSLATYKEEINVENYNRVQFQAKDVA